MIPLTLFLLACGAIYVGTIQAAFSALMRVHLRLLAEGSGRGPISNVTSRIPFACSSPSGASSP